LENKETISACYDYETYLIEKEYALEAAKLLNTKHKVFMIPMNKYFEYLKEAIRAYGLPTYNMTAQALHYYLAGNTDYQHLMLSALAGVVYGQTVRKVPIKEILDRNGMQDWNNWANLYGCQVAREEDLVYISKLFGKDSLIDNLKRRNEYVLKRIENFNFADRGKDNFMQYAHVLGYFTMINEMEADEQVEMPLGKTLSTPYSSRKLLESMLSLDIHHRYEREGFNEKPYAKMLLAERLPGYEVNKKKLGGSLPRTWMVTEGPLRGYFKEHMIPDFVPKQMQNEFKNPGWDNSWSVKYTIMHSIWKEEVFDQSVKKFPSTYFFDKREF